MVLSTSREALTRVLKRTLWDQGHIWRLWLWLLIAQSFHLKTRTSQQGSSSSGIPPQEADGNSQPREAKKTTVPWCPWDKNGTWELKENTVEATQKSLSNIQPPSESWFLSLGGQQFWHTTLGSWQYQPTWETEKTNMKSCCIRYYTSWDVWGC